MGTVHISPQEISAAGLTLSQHEALANAIRERLRGGIKERVYAVVEALDYTADNSFVVEYPDVKPLHGGMGCIG